MSRDPMSDTPKSRLRKAEMEAVQAWRDATQLRILLTQVVEVLGDSPEHKALVLRVREAMPVGVTLK